MRIIYLHQYFNTPQMVGGTRSYEMARRLVSYGHEVHIVTTWREETTHSKWFETREADIHVHWLPVKYSNNMSYGRRIFSFIRFAISAARKTSLLSGDIVFATSTPLTISLPGAFASYNKKIPMVFEVRDLWPELPIAIGALRNPILQRLAKWLERFSYRCSSRIVALSPGMRDGVIETGYPSDKVTVIPNSADLEMFKNTAYGKNTFRDMHPELKNKKLVVYTGTLGVINGVGYLVQIAKEALLIDNNTCFIVVGNGAEKEKIYDLASQTGVLGKNFFMYDAVPKNTVPTVLAAADISLSFFIDLKPMWSNSANKFFDALASGTPVCINYNGWQADLIEKYDVGLTIPPDSPKKSAEMILEKLNTTSWVDTTGERAFNLAKQQFNRDKLALELEQVLLEAVSEC